MEELQRLPFTFAKALEFAGIFDNPRPKSGRVATALIQRGYFVGSRRVEATFGTCGREGSNRSPFSVTLNFASG